MNILIAGDSFAANWATKYPDKMGWPNLLAQKHEVVNIAQAGCSEYRIYQQLLAEPLDIYDVIIVSHTSPYRLYVREHPVHSRDSLHANSDLIYQDVKEHKIRPLTEYFEKYFDLEYAEFTHGLICKEIRNMLADHCSLHLQHVAHNYDPLPSDEFMDCSDIWANNKGLMNHYSDKGNNVIYNSVNNRVAHLRA